MMNDILKQIKAGEVSGGAVLPYTGVGSGITCTLDEDVNASFMNNDKAQELHKNCLIFAKKQSHSVFFR